MSDLAPMQRGKTLAAIGVWESKLRSMNREERRGPEGRRIQRQIDEANRELGYYSYSDADLARAEFARSPQNRHGRARRS